MTINLSETGEDLADHPAVKSVDDFVPDGGVIDSSFLDDAKEVKDISRPTRLNSDRYLLNI